jgi:LuxR family transcriptional regulator, maltose regulon positive regulatory protein
MAKDGKRSKSQPLIFSLYDKITGDVIKMEHRILKRGQIATELNNIFNYPLTLVVAAMGYGKTTAVRDFLDQQKAKYAWLSVESDETSAHSIWHTLTRQLARIEPEFGGRLNTLGFPTDAPQRDRILDLIEDYTYLTNTVLVIDDYHFARSPELDVLMERIIRKKISGFHIIIISRTRPLFNIEELRLKGYCFQLKSSLFELSLDEIVEYFRLFGYDLSAAATNQVYTVTEGWITAVYLIMQHYAETGVFDHGTDINTLMEIAIMSRYTASEAHLLMSLSVLNSFTPQQAIFLTGKKEAAMLVQKMSSDNSLIRYDSQADVYIMHNIFGGYLKELLTTRVDKPVLDSLYRRAGEWEVQNGNLLGGLKLFLKAGEYDLILTEFENPAITRVIDTITAEIVELFEQIPTEAKYRHPIGYIKYANFYLINVGMEGGARLLDQIEQYYRDDQAVSLELKKRIFGEITLARSFLYFNDVQQMHLMHLKAHELLDGSSAIANKSMMVTFGSPHALYLYYRKEGELPEMLELFDCAFPYFQELANGCGTGCEDLARAEYCLETGDLDGAGRYARKAIFRAQPMDQVPIIICGQFTLARMWAARGRFLTAKTVLNDLSIMAAEYHNPVFDNTVELCLGYMGGILADAQSFAPWLKTGDMKHSEIFYQGMSFNYLVYAKYLLLEENFLKLEVLCEELHQHFSIFNNLLGHIHAHILAAASRYRLYGLPEAKAALLQALDLARADSLILPFAEYGVYISDVLRAVQMEKPGDEYLGRLAVESARYRANLQKHHSETAPAIPLTAREKEILRLVIAGKTNREIADTLFIAEVTVKKNVTAVYRKLGARGRAAAVRKALELGLNTIIPGRGD